MKILFALFLSLYQRAVRGLNWMQSPLLLLVRLYWGWQFAQAGWGKLHNLDHVTEFFVTLNIPAPHMNAIVVALVELVGGSLLALGLGSRAVSLTLFINMSVAFVTADREAIGQLFSDPGKFYGADPYTFWFAALVVLLFGPGWISFDRVLGVFQSRVEKINHEGDESNYTSTRSARMEFPYVLNEAESTATQRRSK
jgi:putative oxidoreductase